jgi:hypothetical protein
MKMTIKNRAALMIFMSMYEAIDKADQALQ